MFHTLNTFDTDFSADSIEWCPISSFQDVLLCGTYQLSQTEDFGSTNKEPNLSKRFGKIHMLRVLNNGQLKLLQQLDVSAVLDMKWAHGYNDKILLGIVNSLGYLQLYQLRSKNEEILMLTSETSVTNSQEEVLALSLDWCSPKWSFDNDLKFRIAVSDSKGFISLFQLCKAKIEKITSWHAHEFEAWITAFDYWDANLIYTGGDDSKFQCFDIRINSRSVAMNRVHSAGVTSIHSNADKEFMVASGSYDEKLRLWDRRSFRRPLSETDLGGGIWRLKWDPFEHRYLLAACMYGGFRIIDCKNNDSPTVIGEYNEHQSIAYGCDWSFLTNENIVERNIFKSQKQKTRLIGTCSFYDHMLRVSAIHLEDC